MTTKAPQKKASGGSTSAASRVSAHKRNSTFGAIKHRGAVDGVTGSCHQPFLDENNSILIDCGLFQGAVTSPGRDIQKYGPRHGYVDLEGDRLNINAVIETIGGYSAHADQTDLLGFIK